LPTINGLLELSTKCYYTTFRFSLYTFGGHMSIFVNTMKYGIYKFYINFICSRDIPITPEFDPTIIIP